MNIKQAARLLQGQLLQQGLPVKYQVVLQGMCRTQPLEVLQFPPQPSQVAALPCVDRIAVEVPTVVGLAQALTSCVKEQCNPGMHVDVIHHFTDLHRWGWPEGVRTIAVAPNAGLSLLEWFVHDAITETGTCGRAVFLTEQASTHLGGGFVPALKQKLPDVQVVLVCMPTHLQAGSFTSVSKDPYQIHRH